MSYYVCSDFLQISTFPRWLCFFHLLPFLCYQHNWIGGKWWEEEGRTVYFTYLLGGWGRCSRSPGMDGSTIVYLIHNSGYVTTPSVRLTPSSLLNFYMGSIWFNNYELQTRGPDHLDQVPAPRFISYVSLASHFIFMNLSFLTCRMGILVLTL